MNVGDDEVGVRSVMLKLRNDSMGVYNTLMNVGDDYIRGDRKFSLETDGQRWSWRSGGTHVEDKKYPVKV